jgi:hypothetical protein
LAFLRPWWVVFGFARAASERYNEEELLNETETNTHSGLRRGGRAKCGGTTSDARGWLRKKYRRKALFVRGRVRVGREFNCIEWRKR